MKIPPTHSRASIHQHGAVGVDYNGTPQAIRHLDNLVERIPVLQAIYEQIFSAFTMLCQCAISKHKILICGNGGSAADAEHIAGELLKGFLLKRPLTSDRQKALQQAFPDQGTYLATHLQEAIAAIPLVSGVALPTAFANDVAADMIFAQQVFALGHPGDIIWGISTSGNSPNVIHALRVGKTLGLSTLGLTGDDGGLMNTLCDVVIRVPETSTPLVQELHLPVYHALCAAVEAELFG